MKIRLLLLTILSASRTLAQVPFDSLAMHFYQDTTIVLPLSNSLTLKAKLRIAQPETVGSAYEFEFEVTNNGKINGSIRDTAHGWQGPASFEFVDLTFDGYLDFRVPVESSARGLLSYHTYIYVPARRAFILCETCDELFGDIYLDPQQKKITAAGYVWFYSETVTWQREFSIVNGFPVMSNYNEERFPNEYEESDTTSKENRR